MRESAELVNANGVFLIRGFWDIHVRPVGKAAFQFFPIIRVQRRLGVPDKGWLWDEVIQLSILKRQTEDSGLLGPQIVPADHPSDGRRPMFADAHQQ